MLSGARRQQGEASGCNQQRFTRTCEPVRLEEEGSDIHLDPVLCVPRQIDVVGEEEIHGRHRNDPHLGGGQVGAGDCRGHKDVGLGAKGVAGEASVRPYLCPS